jgi:hypothetical protein
LVPKPGKRRHERPPPGPRGKSSGRERSAPPGLVAGHVTRNGHEAPRPACDGRALGVGHRFGVWPRLLSLRKGGRAVTLGQRPLTAGSRVTTRTVAHAAPDRGRQARLRAWRRASSPRSAGARRGNEPLLGVHEVPSRARRSRVFNLSASSTRRARAISLSRFRMKVSVTTGAVHQTLPDPGASAASTVSTRRASSPRGVGPPPTPTADYFESTGGHEPAGGARTPACPPMMGPDGEHGRLRGLEGRGERAGHGENRADRGHGIGGTHD